MVAPTIFADAATNPFQAKGEPQQITAELATAVIPSTTASATIIGMFRFNKGFSLTAFALKTDDLDSGTNVTIDVGYVYDTTADGTDAPAAFISANAIAQTGTSLIWPIAGGLLTGVSFVATGNGYITLRTGGGATTTTGNASMIGQWTYNQGF